MRIINRYQNGGLVSLQNGGQSRNPYTYEEMVQMAKDRAAMEFAEKRELERIAQLDEREVDVREGARPRMRPLHFTQTPHLLGRRAQPMRKPPPPAPTQEYEFPGWSVQYGPYSWLQDQIDRLSDPVEEIETIYSTRPESDVEIDWNTPEESALRESLLRARPARKPELSSWAKDRLWRRNYEPRPPLSLIPSPLENLNARLRRDIERAEAAANLVTEEEISDLNEILSFPLTNRYSNLPEESFLDPVEAEDLYIDPRRTFSSGGLVSLQDGGNPYAYEDMEDVYREDMYDPPQESVTIETQDRPDSNEQDETEQFIWRGGPEGIGTGYSTALMSRPGTRASNAEALAERGEQRYFDSPLPLALTDTTTPSEEGWFRPGWMGRTAKKAAGVVGRGALSAATGLPLFIADPIWRVGKGMAQHHRNLRKYGSREKIPPEERVDIHSASWSEDDPQEEFSSPQNINPLTGLPYPRRSFSGGGLISLQGGGNPIANNFTQHIREGINSGIRSMVANAYAQGNVPPPSSPQLTQSQLLNQGLTMAPNTANRPVPQQPHAQSNISNVYAQSTQPQSYYMQPNQIR